MKILAIETSCDETALAVVEASGDLANPSFSILATALHSQIDIHKEYGGVFPALAKREHAKNAVPLLSALGYIPEAKQRDVDTDWQEVEKILEREPTLFTQLRNFVETHEKPDIDLLCVTAGPGLEPALWVGINFARALSLVWNIPLLPVNHMEGHIASVLATDHEAVAFPALAILISGGHTEFVLVKNWGEYEKLGSTLDDAVGEAYDKVARMLDLPYPGGPEISKLAQQARDEHLTDESITLPRPMMHTKDLQMSLSGLKTAVLYKVQELGALSDEQKKLIAQEFEQSVVDVLLQKTRLAIHEYGTQSIIVGGGVIANQYIRDNLSQLAEQEGVAIFFPEKEYSTDNAVMIALAGYIQSTLQQPSICPEITASGNWSVASKK